MKEFSFTVTKTGWINVEADSVEDAEAKLQENFGHYYALHTFLEDDELHNIWNIVEKAMNRHGFDVSNSELSMRLYDQEFEENIEHDYMAEYLDSLSEGKDYGSKVDALVDSMGVTDKEVTTTHRRKDMDLL